MWPGGRCAGLPIWWHGGGRQGTEARGVLTSHLIVCLWIDSDLAAQPARRGNLFLRAEAMGETISAKEKAQVKGRVRTRGSCITWHYECRVRSPKSFAVAILWPWLRVRRPGFLFCRA